MSTTDYEIISMLSQRRVSCIKNNDKVDHSLHNLVKIRDSLIQEPNAPISKVTTTIISLKSNTHQKRDQEGSKVTL